MSLKYKTKIFPLWCLVNYWTRIYRIYSNQICRIYSNQSNFILTTEFIYYNVWLLIRRYLYCASHEQCQKTQRWGVHDCYLSILVSTSGQMDSVQQTMNIICIKGSLDNISSVVTQSIDKDVFHYFKEEKSLLWWSSDLGNSCCHPYGRLEECFIVTKKHTEPSKLPLYCGPWTLKLLNKESFVVLVWFGLFL